MTGKLARLVARSLENLPAWPQAGLENLAVGLGRESDNLAKAVFPAPGLETPVGQSKFRVFVPTQQKTPYSTFKHCC